MRPKLVKLTAAETSALNNSSRLFPVDFNASNLSYAVNHSSAGFTSEIEYTMEDVWSSGWTESGAQWVSASGAKTADYSGSITQPITALRLKISGYTSGAVTALAIVQEAGNELTGIR